MGKRCSRTLSVVACLRSFSDNLSDNFWRRLSSLTSMEHANGFALCQLWMPVVDQQHHMSHQKHVWTEGWHYFSTPLLPFFAKFHLQIASVTTCPLDCCGYGMIWVHYIARRYWIRKQQHTSAYACVKLLRIVQPRPAIDRAWARLPEFSDSKVWLAIQVTHSLAATALSHMISAKHWPLKYDVYGHLWMAMWNQFCRGWRPAMSYIAKFSSSFQTEDKQDNCHHMQHCNGRQNLCGNKEKIHTRPACSELSAIHAYSQSPTLIHLAHRITSTHLLHIPLATHKSQTWIWSWTVHQLPSASGGLTRSIPSDTTPASSRCWDLCQVYCRSPPLEHRTLRCWPRCQQKPATPICTWGNG